MVVVPAEAAMSEPLQVEILMRIQPGQLRLPTTWAYDPADPHAINVTFHDDYDEPVWSFARELARQGLHERAGLGDVRLCPLGGRLWLAMKSADGLAMLTAHPDDVRRFLAATYRMVRRGAETVDVDAAVVRILEVGR
jgi:hypothetical protein